MFKRIKEFLLWIWGPRKPVEKSLEELENPFDGFRHLWDDKTDRNLKVIPGGKDDKSWDYL